MRLRFPENSSDKPREPLAIQPVDDRYGGGQSVPFDFEMDRLRLQAEVLVLSVVPDEIVKEFTPALDFRGIGYPYRLRLTDQRGDSGRDHRESRNQSDRPADSIQTSQPSAPGWPWPPLPRQAAMALRSCRRK